MYTVCILLHSETIGGVPPNWKFQKFAVFVKFIKFVTGNLPPRVKFIITMLEADKTLLINPPKFITASKPAMLFSTTSTCMYTYVCMYVWHSIAIEVTVESVTSMAILCHLTSGYTGIQWSLDKSNLWGH